MTHIAVRSPARPETRLPLLASLGGPLLIALTLGACGGVLGDADARAGGAASKSQLSSAPGVAASPQLATAGGTSSSPTPNFSVASRPVTGSFVPAGFSKLVFSDEFDGGDLDRSKWCTRYPYGGGPPIQVPDDSCGSRGRGTLDFLGGGTPTPEAQRYVDFNFEGTPLHRVSGGVLHLIATKTGRTPAAPFESAMIRSKAVFRPSAGTAYFLTARLRLPAVRGTWPAFWLAPGIGPDDKTGWPPEIDILEAPLNDKWDTDNMLTMHAQGQNWGGEGVKGNPKLTYALPEYDSDVRKLRANRNLRGVWLEAGALWSENEACFFLDGVKIACEAYEWKHNNGELAPAAPILINLAIGGWAGRNGIAVEKFPTTFDVDYVRVYQR